MCGIEDSVPDNYYCAVRKDLIDLVPPGFKSVLEIGCGDGNNADYLREKGAIYIAGIELSSKHGKAAKNKMDDVFIGSVEGELPGWLLNTKFDLLICGDVIEHLNNPWKTLIALRNLMSPSGYLLASIPNVRHYSVIKDLVFKGRFHYVSSGLLDRTHLRFFTKSEIVELFENSGYRTVSWSHSEMPKRDSLISRMCFGLLDGFLVYQYYVLAQKRQSR
ncbi:class I SAM-dependent methyltransferase [Mesotoga prima]|uniref:class I SAM-dependent methyltransferase n=1 Tax=Mesotoga prima TaxID=1184387 RepID=UPI002C1A4C73|nr:class I SAM-dependent methyltransferase [Mesotoga prima]HQC15790.1 class I SAM-dependent methyltransferase [Mesotoga prima]